jgi:hypothetical protein
MLAGFLRGLISLDEKRRNTDEPTRFVQGLTDLDFLFLAISSFEARDSWLSRVSRKILIETEEYIECLSPDEKPLVNLWRDEDSVEYPTRRLLSSLKINLDGKNPASVFSRIMCTAVLLHRHSLGASLEQLSSEYDLGEGDIENRLKFTVTWVLSCLSQICDPGKAYKLRLLQLRVLHLLENLSLGASLGALLEVPGIGRRSLERLKTAGVCTLTRLSQCRRDELESIGLTANQALSVLTYARRRNR